MPIKSGPFERTVISCEDARAFLRAMRQSRGIKAAVASANSGRKLVADFAATGAAHVELKGRKLAEGEVTMPVVPTP